MNLGALAIILNRIFYHICIVYKIANTIVWKIFVWNYFVVENVRENNFRGLPIPTKIF